MCAEWRTFILLDCRAALAMNPSEAQDAARTQSAGDTRAGTIYYLCSIIYALKKRPNGAFLTFAVAVCYVNLATRFLCAIHCAFGLAAAAGLNVLHRQTR